MSKSKVKVSFVIEVDDDSELGEMLEYLDSRKLMSRLKQKIADHITEECRKNPYYLDSKTIDVRFLSQIRDNREQIIHRMCLTYRHDYLLEKIPGSISSGTTEEERKFLWNQMSQIFDNDISPFMEFKTIDNNNLEEKYE